MVSAVSSISNMLERAGGVSSAQSLGAAQSAGSAQASAAASTNFGDMMAQMASSAVDTVKAGEAASIAGIQGKASVQQVVEAVMSAEQTLQIAISIRDKVVGAYQEISRMTI